jgi:hypothetical protein
MQMKVVGNKGTGFGGVWSSGMDLPNVAGGGCVWHTGNTSDSVCEEGELVDCRCVAESVWHVVSKVVHIVCPLVVRIECDLNMFPCDRIGIHVCISALID